MDRVDESALVRRAKEGDGRAIEALIRAHQEALYAFILRMSGRPETAEDIVQEALVRVLGNIHRFDSRFRFSTWLFTIAKRLYLNANQKLSPAFDTEAVEARQGAWPDDGRQDRLADARRLIDRAIDELPDRQREIVLLYHHHEWPVAEIADGLRMPIGTVKSHLHRARARMKRFFEDDPRLRRLAEEVLA